MATAEFSPPDVNVQSAGVALQGRLSALARRRNAQKMGQALVRWAIPGVGVAAASVLLYKLHIIEDGPLWAPPAIIGVSLLFGLRSGLAQRVGSFAAACDADRILGFEDRLSSALSFVEPAQLQRKVKLAPEQGRLGQLKARLFPKFALSKAVVVPATNLVPALVGEAAGRAQNVDPKKVYPLRFDRPALVLTALTILFTVFCVMPDYAILRTAAQQQQVVAIQKAGEKLVAIAKTIQKDPKPKAEEVKELSRRLEKLGQKMVRGRMTKRAALTQMGELRQQLEKAQKQPKGSAGQNQGSPQIAEALRQAPLQSEAGRKIQDKLAQNKWEEAAKELDDLADKVEKGTLSDQEKEKTAQDLEKTARDLRSRGGQANQEAAKQLESAANQLRQKQPQGQGQQGQQGQQNGQQNQGQQGQKQQGQSGQQGQQGQQQQQGGQKQNQSGQQGGQEQGGQQQQQGGQKQGSQGQQQQQGGQQQQSQQSQNGQQSQQGGQQQQQQSQGGQGQQGQSNQQGSQGGQGQTGQSGEGSSDQQGTADALRNMANGLRQGGTNGGGSQDMRNMMDKLREAENQTGSNGGEQSGMGKPGQGDGQSGTGSQGDMRQRVTPGKDISPSDPHGMVGGGGGMGPRNNAQGVQHGGGVSKMKSVSTGDKRRYADAWSNRLPKTHGRIDRITGKWGSSGDMEQMATKGDAKGGQVKTPYYQAYESYKNDPEEATSRDNVPPAYKDSVKNYFESIKP